MIRKFAVTLLAVLVLEGLAMAQATEPTPLPPPVEVRNEVVQSPDVSLAPTGGAVPGGPFQEQWWARADYIFGWVRSANLPTLVTTSPTGTAQVNAGVLGKPGTSVLFGDSVVNGDLRSGFQVGGGTWLTDDQYLGVDVGFFILESRASGFAASSAGDFILARPFTEVSRGPTSVLIAYPGVSSGSVGVLANSGSVYGAHLDFQEAVVTGPHFRLTTLVGYRFFRFDDGLEINQTVFPTGSTVVPGTKLESHDSFAAENEFNGGEIGFRAEWAVDRWSLDFLTKAAVGNLHRVVNIAGQSRTTIPGTTPTDFSGGVLALEPNSGRHIANDWEILPEIAVNMGYEITTNLRVRVGYSLLFLTGVARAADQVDLTINQNFFPPATSNPGVARPAFNPQCTGLWLQTLKLGVEWQF